MSIIPRIVITLVAFAAVGGFIADVVAPETARRHLKNPMWPPHAKFHNGQGVLMGVGLALLTPWLLFGLQPQTLGTLAAGAIAASLYWVSMLGSILLPGTAWSDPEFAEALRLGMPAPKIAALAFTVVDVAAFTSAVAIAHLPG